MVNINNILKLILNSGWCYRIYDAYHGLIMEKIDGEKASHEFQMLMEEFAGNFYYRVFNESFDFVYVFGDVYFSDTHAKEEIMVFLADELINKVNATCSAIKAYKDPQMPSGLRYFGLEGDYSG